MVRHDIGKLLAVSAACATIPLIVFVILLGLALDGGVSWFVSWALYYFERLFARYITHLRCGSVHQACGIHSAVGRRACSVLL